MIAEYKINIPIDIRTGGYIIKYGILVMNFALGLICMFYAKNQIYISCSNTMTIGVNFIMLEFWICFTLTLRNTFSSDTCTLYSKFFELLRKTKKGQRIKVTLHKNVYYIK